MKWSFVGWKRSCIREFVRSGAIRLTPTLKLSGWLRFLYSSKKRLETHFDLTVCVSSSYEIILRRMEGRGYSKSETEQRMCRQMPLADKMSRADHVIFNAGSIEFLKQQTTCLIQQLRQSPTKSD